MARKKKVTFSRPEGAGNYDNMDDFNIVQTISTRQGTIQHTPTNNKDIVNKEYVDDSIIPQTYLHEDLTDITANQHHNELHTIASHSDTTATGTELDTLTDDSMADSLHRHSELSASDGSPSPALSVDASGNVGIGTATPKKNLQIEYNNEVTDVLANGLGGGNLGDGLLIRNTNTGADTYANLDFRTYTADGRIAFQTNGVSNEADFHFITDNSGSAEVKMTLTNGGNLEVATPTSGSTLLLGRASGEPSIEANADTGGWLIMESGGTGTGRAALNYFNTDDVILAYGGGNVGIGTITPEAMLDVYDASTSTAKIRVANHHATLDHVYETNIKPFSINGNIEGAATGSNLVLSTTVSDGGSYTTAGGNIIIKPYTGKQIQAYGSMSRTTPLLNTKLTAAQGGIASGSVEGWHEVGATSEPAFQNSWSNYGNVCNTLAFRKTPDGMVIIKGMVNSGTIGSDIFTLPVGYRPIGRSINTVYTSSGAARMDIEASGNVKSYSATTTWNSVEITFFAG